MKNSKNLFGKLVKSLFLILCIVVYLTFFSWTEVGAKFILPNAIIFIIALLIVLLLGMAVYKVGKSKIYDCTPNIKKENKCLLIASATLLLFQIILIYMIAFRTAWDPGAVHYGAHYAAINDIDGMNNMSEYFSYYPNNLFITFLFSVIYKFNTSFNIISNGTLLPVFLQAFISTVTAALTYKCARQFLSVFFSWVVYAIYVILIGTSPWLVIAYSDSTGLIFPILLIYLYMKWRNNKRIIWIVCIGITSIVGFMIKPMALIVLIAIGMVEFTAAYKEKVSVKKILSVVAVLLFSCGIAYVVCLACISSLNYEINSEKELGISHHFMLGLNSDTNGGYSQEDFDFSDSFSDKDIRHKAEIDRAFGRIKEYGFFGLLRHGFNKMTREYTDGTYGWDRVDGFYVEVNPERDSVVCPILRRLYYQTYYENNTLYEIHALIRDIIWVMVLLCLFGVMSVDSFDCRWQTMVLAMVGLMIYLLLFEAHPRYLFTFVPLFLITSVRGFAEKTSDFFKK